MKLGDIVSLLTSATGVLSAAGTQAMLGTVSKIIDEHLKNEQFSIDKLKENETLIPDPVYRTDQPKE